ncbi:MAG: tRNA pseudouridine synthase A [Candidatus Methanomethylophilaceae archaeon]
MNGRRVAVRIAYLGKMFSGSQIQPGLYTVEGQVISDLLATGDGRPEEWFDLKLSSRTDAGVNSYGNVIVFNTAFKDNESLLRALNAVSKNVFYMAIADVDMDFNPRYADSRTYLYKVTCNDADIDRMRECAEIFKGRHDFKRFCKYDGKPTETELTSVKVLESENGIFLEFRSRYFLWNMIRRISSAIIEVGRGRAEISEVEEVLDGKEGNFGLGQADALTLTEVTYDTIEFTEYGSEPLRNRSERLLESAKMEAEFYGYVHHH